MGDNSFQLQLSHQRGQSGTVTPILRGMETTQTFSGFSLNRDHFFFFFSFLFIFHEINVVGKNCQLKEKGRVCGQGNRGQPPFNKQALAMVSKRWR